MSDLASRTAFAIALGFALSATAAGVGRARTARHLGVRVGAVAPLAPLIAPIGADVARAARLARRGWTGTHPAGSALRRPGS